jgi:hypothetical protein
MSETVYLESKGSVCELRGSGECLGKILADDFTRHFIPDLRVHSSLRKKDVEVVETELEIPTRICYPDAYFRENLPSRDIVSLCEYLLERSRQEKRGYYSLNSATSSLGDRAVIFFAGATNSGKTSGMLDLIQNHGFDFYCDEHTLLDLENRKVVGGSRSIAIRKKVLKDKLSNGNEFYPEKSDEAEKNASLFVYPHVDHGLDEPISYQFIGFFLRNSGG